CKTRLKSSNSAPPGIIDVDGTKLLTNLDKAQAFSKYFASVSSSPLLSPLLPSTHSQSESKFDLASITLSQILIAIRSLSPKCNTSPDGIPNIVYSKCKFSIISPLLIIFNKSLLNNSIPAIWKHAIVKPIPKSSSNSINCFRPISLTCSVTKIFEKILISEITEYLEANNILDPHQAGFRLNRSTCTQFINGIPLSVSPSMKDLGILMQPSLKFNDHVTKIISKARAQVNMQTLEHRRFLSDLLFLHKSIHGFYSYDHSSLYIISPLTRNLRRAHSLRVSLPFASPKSHSSFVTRRIDRWNVFSNQIVTSSPKHFRSHLLSLPSISFTSDSLLRV
ncbi:hypothetical protein PMAYCL1PPCAC_05626, partial [Pristionchus mayeri]